MDNLLHFVQTVNSYLSDYILVILLIGVGLWYSIKTNFVQVRCFGEGMKKVFGNLKLNGEKHESGMSSFQALATAIAAQVGTGNIVGASGAILTGPKVSISFFVPVSSVRAAFVYMILPMTCPSSSRTRSSSGTKSSCPRMTRTR